MRIVSIPEREMFSVPGGLGVCALEGGNGVTERETTPASLLSLDSETDAAGVSMMTCSVSGAARTFAGEFPGHGDADGVYEGNLGSSGWLVGFYTVRADRVRMGNDL